MRKSLAGFGSGLFFIAVVWGQSQAPQPSQQKQIPPMPVQPQTVVVTGTWEPVPLEESDRSVNVYSLSGSHLLFGDLTDVLDLDSSVQVQSRGAGGVQADISIRGGSFEQTLFLLDGIRLNDAQSAHYDMDLPLPLDAISRMEVLRGSGSTLYGSDAVGGVINLVTAPPNPADNLELRLRVGYGSFGTNEESGFLAFTHDTISQRFSFERELSDGFRDDREYRNLAIASESWLKTRLGLTRVFLSFMDRPFGADQFYGNYNSWERTKTWLATLSQDLGRKTLFTLAYRRHTDLYELLRDDPVFYTNRHIDDSWNFALRRQDSIRDKIHVFYGMEGTADYVNSTNLGVHSRRQGALYGAVSIAAWHRFSLNGGTRQEFYGNAQTGKLETINVPSFSAGYWLSSKAKLYASASRAFRLPSFTDLYYHDPANIGNPNLQPERAMNYEFGADAYPNHRMRLSAAVFERRESDDIDYIRANPSDMWQATNFTRLNFTGWEASLHLSLTNAQQLQLEYTGLHGASAALDGYQSQYVFNYPTQQATIGWERLSRSGWLARVRTGITNQYERNAYVVVDAYGAWTRSRLHPYLRLTNLTNADYQPVYGVVMPGRAALVGLEWCVFCHAN
jgi:iron complex outermembrane receptor protein